MNHLDAFRLQNPWRFEKEVSSLTPYVERRLYTQLERWLEEDEILLLIGPRQSGKTTLLKKIVAELLKKGIPNQAIFYFSMDDENLRELFQSYTHFIQFIQSYSSVKERTYILIDEVQRVANAGLFLKQIYDLKLNLKLIVTGSSSLEIRSQVHEYLTGRKRVFHLYPFSFLEIISHQEPRIVASPFTIDSPNPIEEMDRLYGSYLEEKMKQFLLFGGYPKVIIQAQIDKKIELIDEIYTSYVQKDVKDFLQIENVGVFNRLVSLLAYQIGNLVNRNELTLSLQSSWITIEKYLHVLRDTFVVDFTLPYFSNKRKETVKMQKVYFADLGLRNGVIHNFNPIEARGDKGALYENAVLLTLRESFSILPVQFWRTQSGSEVDFVLEHHGKLSAIEVKGLLKRPEVTKSAKTFIETYKPTKVFVVNQNLLTTQTVLGCQVIFVPLRWFLLAKSFE